MKMKMRWLSCAAVILLGLCQMSQAGLVNYSFDTNLVVGYSFDNSSDPWNDDSGHGNDLYPHTGTPVYDASGKFGGSVSFNQSGTGQGLTTTNVNVLTPSFTVALWIQPAITTNQRIVWNSSGTTPTSGYTIYTDAAGELTFATHKTGAAYALGSDVFATSSWQHVAMTFTPDGDAVGGIYTGTLKAYVNGILANTRTDAQYDPLSTTKLRLAIRTSSTATSFTGEMDDVRVYDRALTGGEIMQLIPEPATMSLIMIGLAGIPFVRHFLHR